MPPKCLILNLVKDLGVDTSRGVVNLSEKGFSLLSMALKSRDIAHNCSGVSIQSREQFRSCAVKKVKQHNRRERLENMHLPLSEKCL